MNFTDLRIYSQRPDLQRQLQTAERHGVLLGELRRQRHERNARIRRRIVRAFAKVAALLTIDADTAAKDLSSRRTPRWW